MFLHLRFFVTAYRPAETTFNPGAGMVFDDNTLFAGLVGDMTLAAALTSYTGGTGDPSFTIFNPGTLTFGKVSLLSRSGPIFHLRPGCRDI